MKQIYKRIWGLAKPFYLKGRKTDLEHIKWMMNQVEKVCKAEKIDDSVLMPLAILHDAGYSTLKNKEKVNYSELDVRKKHMESGAKIAKNILAKVNYPQEKIKQITYCVSVHDNWAFGDIDLYKKDKILGVFKDLDYLWAYTKKGSQEIQKTIKGNKIELINYLEKERTPIFNQKPFSTKYTKELRNISLGKLKKSYGK